MGSNKLVVGVNDLATVHPELLNEWDYEKNDKLGIYPDKVAYGSSVKVWWKCSNGHSYQSTPNNRVNRRSCPYCSNKKILVGYNDLATLRPDLAKEWNYEKNGDLLPSCVATKSSKKVWWKCKQGHEWEAKISNRSVLGRNCPYCCNQKILKGYNDLASNCPDLAKEWDYNKNGNLTPLDIGCNSIKKVWWKCKFGHSWKTSVVYRYKGGTGCPKCSSVFGSSFGEQTIYYYLIKYLHNEIILNRYKFKDNIGSFEVDIFLPIKAIAIEYDGEYWHKNKKVQDNEKTDRLFKLGIKLIRVKESNYNRFENNVISYNYNASPLNINFALQSLFSLLGFSENLMFDVSNDRISILELFHQTVLSKSLSVLYPDIAIEWHPTKNGFLKPEHFLPYSTHKVWWKCKQGHEWEAKISSRVSGNNCPYCSNKKVLKGFNDLTTVKSDLLKEWDYEENNNLGIYPDEVTYGSNKIVWWKCSRGHKWQAKIGERSHGTCCPICSNHQVLVGYNDLATVRPDLLKEWNYKKNINVSPNQVTSNANRKVWWICEKGHEWEANINNRAGNNNIKGTGCPYCANQKVLKGFNDLQSKYPEIAIEWDYEKNGDVSPDIVLYGSSKKYWWKCKKCGHSWLSTVVNRTNGHGCSKCRDKDNSIRNSVPVIGQSLQDRYPEIANDWNYEKNGDLKPIMVKPGSNKDVWWKCQKGHEKKSSVYSRVRSHGCSDCKKIKNK